LRGIPNEPIPPNFSVPRPVGSWVHRPFHAPCRGDSFADRALVRDRVAVVARAAGLSLACFKAFGCYPSGPRPPVGGLPRFGERLGMRWIRALHLTGVTSRFGSVPSARKASKGAGGATKRHPQRSVIFVKPALRLHYSSEMDEVVAFFGGRTQMPICMNYAYVGFRFHCCQTPVL